ncbi:MAG: glycerol-3-phosphate acyltransferase [Dehalococcoidia bacterium]|nr:MAG: glycerol-3-phosphate acyltransferase [Dehalococcoidia bacterium]
MIIAKFVGVVVIGYLLGSIPFGVIISKRRGIDVTQHGSGKTGTANVLRTAGSKTAAMVFGLDLLKGILAVVVAGLIIGRGYLVVGGYSFGMLIAQVMAALAAIAGHNWSVFLKFHGGRGVATFFGGLVALCPLAALFGGEVFIIGAGLSKFVSLGSIAAVVSTYAVLIPLTIVHGFPIEYLIYALIGAVVVLVTHRSNIARLLRGKERRLGDKAKGLPSSANPKSKDSQGH